MAFILKRKQVDYMALDKGTYPARLVGIIGTGEQVKSFKDKKEMRDQIVLLFEVINLNRRHKNGTEYMIEVNGQQVPEPQTVRKECTRSLAANSALVKILSALIPIPDDVSEIDIESALMKPCLVALDKNTSETTGNEYNVLEAISPPIVGMEIPPARMQPISYDVESHTDEAFNALPEWLQEEVKKSTQWIDMHANSTPVATAPPNMQAVAGQMISTVTGEVVAQQIPMQPPLMQTVQPVTQAPTAQLPVMQQPMVTGTAQKAPF